MLVRHRAEIAVVVLVAIIVAGGILALVAANSPSSPTPAVAKLVAHGNGAAITQGSDGRHLPLIADQSSEIRAGDTVQGSGTLIFADTQLELAPTTEMSLVRYTTGGETRIEVTLKAGQLLQQIGDASGDRVLYTVNTVAGSLVTRGGKYLTFIDKNGNTQHGAVYGAANVTGAGRTLVLAQGQGTTISTGTPPSEPILWSAVNVTTYQPDGSSQVLPAILSSTNGDNQFYFTSGQTVIVPPGTYNLKIMALIAYQANDLVLDTQRPNEFSVSLAQAVFTTVDEVGNTIPYTGLTLSDDQKAHVRPQQPVLISPGSSTLNVADDDKPNAVQPVAINIKPGQKATIPIRTVLFGGAKVKVNISVPDGISLSPLNINVYAAANEDGAPVDTFSSDSSSSLLPPGNYLVIVPTDIAGRYPVTIANNLDVTVDAGLGTLSISYHDASGQPTNPLVYIAAADEMQRLDLPIDKMQQTKYGKYARSGTMLLVPKGKYNIRVDDPKKAVDVADVEIQSRQNLVLSLSGADS